MRMTAHLFPRWFQATNCPLEQPIEPLQSGCCQTVCPAATLHVNWRCPVAGCYAAPCRTLNVPRTTCTSSSFLMGTERTYSSNHNNLDQNLLLLCILPAAAPAGAESLHPKTAAAARLWLLCTSALCCLPDCCRLCLLLPVDACWRPQMQSMLERAAAVLKALLTLCFWRSSDDRGALISLRLSLEAAVK